ncbi:hypothetical protein GGE12_005212 [Rhizobium mongolense]|uniref:Uncharacterized protein n=1 Tax=Rhizobium mongolense TaxID=57676 RepID=A0A7W6RRP6_9HYPH|nr:hypothetical protein [Rhizobium mongolense]
MTTLPMTSLFAAGFALALIALSIPISLQNGRVLTIKCLSAQIRRSLESISDAFQSRSGI